MGTTLSATKTILADAAVASVADGFALTLSLRDAETTRHRTIKAPTCEELGRAAALIVAIAVDPTVLERHELAQADAAGISAKSREQGGCHCRLTDLPLGISATPRCPPEPVCASPRTPEDLQPEQPLRYRFGFGAKATVKALPQPSVGPSALVAYQVQSLRVQLTGDYQSAQAKSQEHRERGGDFKLLRLAPSVCWLVAGTAWAAGPCAVVEGGVLTAKGFGLLSTGRQNAPWFASGLGALAEIRVTPQAYLTVTGELGLPWAADKFTLAGEALFTPGIYGNLGVGLTAGW